jgi:hypothetical protein
MEVMMKRLARTAPILALAMVLAGCTLLGWYNGGIAIAAPGEEEAYILFAPLRQTTTYLIDLDGNVVHEWELSGKPGNAVYLLEGGNLLASYAVTNSSFPADGSAGGVELLSWDGNQIWSFEYATSDANSHHDVEILPNGNVLMIAWELKTQAEALAAGRDPSLLKDGEVWPGHIIEVDPAVGTIVWEWHAWDHLVQNYSPTKDNYGAVAEHPELIDLNFVSINAADWFHSNAIDYNAELDQIMVSIHSFSEIWIIDHSTTTAEAAGHTSGNSGMGGDLLYRWGNPKSYDAGTATDQQFFGQHDAEWIGSGLPGEGNILVFNNGRGRSDGEYSSIVEIETPLNMNGSYSLAQGSAYGPAEPVWVYTASPRTSLYSQSISGSQRLPSGNTLICVGDEGRFFEVTPSGETIWEYVNPLSSHQAVFRCERYEADSVELAGRDLSGGEPLEGSQTDEGPPSGQPPTGPPAGQPPSRRP